MKCPPAAVARLLLLSLLPMALDGCVSVGLRRTPLAEPSPGGSLEVTVFERTADQEAGSASPLPVLSQLFVLENGAERLLAQSMSSRWGLPELPAGAYVLKVTKRIDARGDVVALPRPATKRFDVRSGERASVDVVLRKVPVGLIVLAAITVVVLVVLSIELARHGKLPVPPLPPHPHHLPVVVTFPLGRATTSAMDQPGVADVFPARGSVVAAPRVTVSFFLTTPVDRIEPGAVQALGSRSGDLPGDVSYRAEEQLLQFRPARDFTPGERVTVTLDLSRLSAREGSAGRGTFTTTFEVPGPRTNGSDQK